MVELQLAALEGQPISRLCCSFSPPTVWRPVIRADAARPIHARKELPGHQNLSVRAVEDVKEAIAIGMQQQASRLPPILRVNQHRRLVCIPIMHVVRSELEVPFDRAVCGFRARMQSV